jgi:hypothetical protein
MLVYRLTEPIDDFDGLTPLHRWLADDAPQRTAWVLAAVLALADATRSVGWRGDMRHLPMVGVLPTSPQTTPYLVVKQDDNGATFIITEAEPDWIDQSAASINVTTHAIGAWQPHPGDPTEPEPGAGPAPC